MYRTYTTIYDTVPNNATPSPSVVRMMIHDDDAEEEESNCIVITQSRSQITVHTVSRTLDLATTQSKTRSPPSVAIMIDDDGLLTTVLRMLMY